MSEEIELMESVKTEAAILEAKKELEELSVKEGSPVEKTEEGSEVVEKQSERVFSEVEITQMEKGWDPYHKGPNAVSAEEYKRVGEIIEAKRKASKEAQLKSSELEQYKKLTKDLLDRTRLAEKNAYDKAIRDLSNTRIKKMEEGDVEAVLAIEREQASLPRPIEIKEPVVEQNDNQYINDPDVVKFREEFKGELEGKSSVDKAFQAYILKRAAEFDTTNPNLDVKATLEVIRGELKEIFPNKFSNPNKEKPSITMKSTVSSESSDSKFSPSKLSFEQRSEFALIKKADPTYTIDEYTKSLKLVGRLTND